MTLAVIRTPLHTPHKGEILLAGRFRANGTSAPTSIIGNWISSVAYAATGIWTVTMKTEYVPPRGVFAVVSQLEMDADASLSFVQNGPISLSAGTFKIRSFTEGAGTIAAAAIAAGSNNGNWVHLMVAAKYSTAPDGSGIT